MKVDPDLVRKAILNIREAMQRGDRQAVRDWAMQAIALDPDSEEPWLYLAAISSPRASINYLDQALKINPNSRRARKGMLWAEERLKREQSKAQPHVYEEPAQSPAHLAPPENLNLPKPVARHRKSRSWKRFSSRWQNWIGVLLVSLFILVALAAPLISPNNPKSPGPFMNVPGLKSQDDKPLSPAVIPPLGTLPKHIDLFHALIWGTRDALTFGLEVTILAALLGLLFGAIAGYVGGIVNSIMMRITDSFLAFPIIAGVVFLSQLWYSAIVASGGIWDWVAKLWVTDFAHGVSPLQALLQAISPLMLVLILFSWMPYARLTNVIVITLKKVEFVQAARAIGTRPTRIILRHLIPNSITPSVVLAARDVGSMVLLQAAFTFIGLDGSSTWGNILAMGRDWILGPGGGIFAYWWVYIPATLALVLFGIGWNLLGDGLSELLDPRDD